MDVKDPVQLLRMVAARTEIMKSARAADVVALAGAWLGAAPPPVQAVFWQTLPYITFPLPLLNLICTNVPGSPAPLYAVGRRMIASYPQVPTGYELGIGCAVQSYAGKLCFGLTSDFQAAPDAHRLRDFVEVSFRELCRAAGVETAAPRREPAKAKRGKKPRAAAVDAKPRKQKAEPAPEVKLTADAEVPPRSAATAPRPRKRTPAAASAKSLPVRAAAGQRKRKGNPASVVEVLPAVPAAGVPRPEAAPEPLAKSTVA
jgi:diacylglycerol O-acyltransferase